MKDKELEKMRRILEDISEHLEDAVASFNKYSRDPARFKPQLENLEQSLHLIRRESMIAGFILRPEARDEYFRRISPRR